jgi:hypothetical protein
VGRSLLIQHLTSPLHLDAVQGASEQRTQGVFKYGEGAAATGNAAMRQKRRQRFWLGQELCCCGAKEM